MGCNERVTKNHMIYLFLEIPDSVVISVGKEMVDTIHLSVMFQMVHQMSTVSFNLNKDTKEEGKRNSV